jgi:hypothetical protein
MHLYGASYSIFTYMACAVAMHAHARQAIAYTYVRGAIYSAHALTCGAATANTTIANTT